MTVTFNAIPRGIVNTPGNTIPAVMLIHVAVDTADPRYIYLDNSVAYQYYAVKIADNYGATYNLGLRRIVLQTSDGLSPPSYTDHYPPSQDATHVKVTSDTSSYRGYYATDPSKSLIGTPVNMAWRADAGSAQRFHIDLGSTHVITRIYYENFHWSGASLDEGCKNITVWGSNTASAFADVTYGNDANWTQIPIQKDGAVRFFPVTTSTKPITGYDWNFGDGTSHGTDACPVHTYPAVITYTTYDVTLVLTYADGTTESSGAIAKYISSDISANIPFSTQVNSIISVFLYSATKMMMVHRIAWTGSSYYLIDPKITNSIDKIGTATFSLADIGNSTADEQGLVVEGTNVIIIMGRSIAFSGVIRRTVQDVTSAFSSATKFVKWDIECDSDLAKPQKLNVDPSVFTVNGEPIIDTVGNIARKILTGTPDIRGVIDCTGSKIAYQLNSANQSESVGNQYDHLMALAAQSNYDLRSRPSYFVFPYSSFNGSTVLTAGGGGDTPVFTVNEFQNMYVFFVNRATPVSYTFTTNYVVNNTQLLFTDANKKFVPTDMVKISSTGTLPTGLTPGTYYVVGVISTAITISSTRGGAAKSFTDNGTGTHSIIFVDDRTGVPFYGKVASNTATTITLTGVIGIPPPNTSSGYFILYRGYYSIDFAPDISQPSVVRNLDSNSTCFGFNDNDDKRKLSTNIVVSGKDLQGKTISVAISGVHAYDTTAQFFNDSTFITKPSEGYIYKNSYAPDATPATFYPRFVDSPWTIDGGDNSKIVYTSGGGVTTLGGHVFFTKSVGGTLPSPLNVGQLYYVVESASNYCVVSDTLNGTVILLTGGSGTWYITYTGGLYVDKISFSEGDYITLSGTTAPGGCNFGSVFQATSVVKNENASGYCHYSCTSAGSNVWVHKTANVINPGYTSSLFNTTVYVWLYGWGYVIPANTVMAIVYGSTAISVIATSYGGYAKTEEVSENGVLLTKITMSVGSTTSINNMFHGDQNFAGKGFLMSPRLYVDNHARIGGNYEVLIGEEKITITARGNDTTYGNYIDVGTATSRVTSATKKCYPHGVGALVARTNYTEVSPETGSPVALHGLRIGSRTVDSNITYGILDAYATSLLLGLGNFWRKATTWSPLDYAYILQTGQYYKAKQVSGSSPITIGDNVTITTFAGDTAESYEVVETTIIANEGRMMIVLGDYEKNAFTSLLISTNAINKTIT
jgi:hypothetical protein